MGGAARVAAQDEFTRLIRAESFRLLAGVPVGRLIFTSNALPAVRPMKFALVDGLIVLRTVVGTSASGKPRNARATLMRARKLGTDAEERHKHAYEALDRSRALLAASRERLDRIEATLRRSEGRVAREQSELDRLIFTRALDLCCLCVGADRRERPGQPGTSAALHASCVTSSATRTATAHRAARQGRPSITPAYAAAP
jgi:hypothetical protein